jgi:hypothetical protein
MRLLRSRPPGDARDVLEAVRHGLPLLEPGLRFLDRVIAGGEAAADAAAVDAQGRLTVVVCELEAGPGAVLRVIESAAWCAEHRGVVQRLDAALVAAAPPRALLVAARFSDRAARLLRTLGAAAPAALECVVFEDGDERFVSFQPLTATGAASHAVPAGPAGAAAAPAGTGAPGTVQGGAPTGAATVGRLKFTEAFK